MEKTTDFTIVESLKDQKKIHMLIINVPYVLLKPQCTNKMEYLLITISCCSLIYLLYTWYKLNKIWKNIEQNELELIYYSSKNNYDYINMDSGKNNRQGANVCIKSIDTDYPSTTIMFKTKKDNDY